MRMRRKLRGLVLSLAVVMACGFLLLNWPSRANSTRLSAPDRGLAPEVFTTAHSSLLDSLRDFAGWRPQPIQAIAFTHKKHIENQIECVVCHQGVNESANAGLPSAKVCLHCHTFFATDSPEIKKLTAIYNSGLDVSWQRVYGFTPSAHVKFNHAPHVHVGIDCSNCHGNVKDMTVAVRTVDINMGFCLGCHRRRQASTDCITCHY